MISIRRNTFCQIICYLFVACVPLTWASFLGGSVYRMVTIALTALFALIVLTGKGFFIKQNALVGYWSAFMLYIIAVIPFSLRSSNAEVTAAGYLLVYVIVIIFSVTTWTDEQRRWLDVVWIGVGLVCAIAYLFGAQTKVGNYGERTTLMVLGTATDPNEFAGVFIVPISLCVYRAFTEGKLLSKIVYLALVVLEIAVVFMSGSRGALLGVLLAVIIALLLPKKNAKTVMLISVFFVAAVLLISQFVLPMIPESVLLRFSLENLQESGGSHRMIIWELGLEAFLEGSAWNILFGFGPSGLNVATPIMHNQVLQVLVDYGVFGALLFLILLWNIFRSFYKSNKAYLGGYLGMLLLSMTLTMPASYKPLWIIMIMALVTVDGNGQTEPEMQKTVNGKGLRRWN